MTDLERSAARMADRDDAFFAILEAFVSTISSSQGLSDGVFRSADLAPRLEDLRERCDAMLAPLLQRAQAKKLVRPEIKRSDIRLVLAAFGGVRGMSAPKQRTANLRRAIALLRLGRSPTG